MAKDAPQLQLAGLLRAARRTTANAIRTALEEAGYGDLPVNGPYVMTAVSVGGIPLAEIIERLGLSKQASGHLVDVLVSRGYLVRETDPSDRRRLVVWPTARGRAAAVVVAKAAAGVESRLVAAVGKADLETTRRVLSSLALLNDEL